MVTDISMDGCGFILFGDINDKSSEPLPRNQTYIDASVFSDPYGSRLVGYGVDAVDINYVKIDCPDTVRSFFSDNKFFQFFTREAVYNRNRQNVANLLADACHELQEDMREDPCVKLGLLWDEVILELRSNMSLTTNRVLNGNGIAIMSDLMRDIVSHVENLKAQGHPAYFAIADRYDKLMETVAGLMPLYGGAIYLSSFRSPRPDMDVDTMDGCIDECRRVRFMFDDLLLEGGRLPYSPHLGIFHWGDPELMNRTLAHDLASLETLTAYMGLPQGYLESLNFEVYSGK